MTSFIHVASNTYPLSESQVKQRELGTSFPSIISGIDVAHLGYLVVAPYDPTYNSATHHKVEIPPIIVSGTYRQAWSIVAYTQPELAQLAADASASTLSEARSVAVESANMTLLATLSSGFTFDGTLWHCDATFQSQLQGFVLAFVAGVLPPASTVLIRAKDNSLHALTRGEINALASALMLHIQTAYARSWATKDAVGA